MKRELQVYLNDIIEALQDIESFTRSIAFAEFRKDKKTQYATIRCLEIIGEAVKKLPKDFREEHAAIPWKEIAGMRDKLIHEYFGVDIEMLWDTIQEDLTSMDDIIKEISQKPI